MRRFLAICVVLLPVLLTGCARASITTAIHSDGTWTRTVVLSGQDKKDAGPAGASIEDAFIAPTGDGWKSHSETKEGDRTLTFERTLPSGASLKGDLSVRGRCGNSSHSG